MRRKHVPQRTCIACGETKAKRQLLRIARTPEGTMEIDLGGKKSGRGAYLCRRVACWEKALSKGAIERALRAVPSAEEADKLRSQLHLLQLEKELADAEVSEG
jgi:predicted RNA-binding protein YlxR (DUF448 family)